MPTDSLWSYTAAGYLVTVVALGGYVALLFRRGRRARARAAATAERQRGRS